MKKILTATAMILAAFTTQVSATSFADIVNNAVEEHLTFTGTDAWYVNLYTGGTVYVDTFEEAVDILADNAIQAANVDDVVIYRQDANGDGVTEYYWLDVVDYDPNGEFYDSYTGQWYNFILGGEGATAKEALSDLTANVFEAGFKDGYENGYANGYADGYIDGYTEGFYDGQAAAYGTSTSLNGVNGS